MITLGLDLGHTSIGWTLIDTEKGEILDGGVQIFEAPEDEKHRTLASIRREARSTRVNNKHHKKRILNIKRLCSSYGLVDKKLLITPKNGIAPLFRKGIKKDSSLKLRTKGLDELLNGKELTRVILHIANRRGFKYDIDEESDEDAGKIKEAQGALKEEFLATNYRTYGEFLYKEYELKGKKTRNRVKKDGSSDYKFSIHRDDLEYELRAIFAKQQELKSPYVTDEFRDKVLIELLFVHEPKSLKRMIGKCSLIKGEKRASKALYSSELFVARNILINLRVKEPEEEEYRALSSNEIEALLKAGHQKKIGKKDAKTILNISQKSKFKGDEDDNLSHIVHFPSLLRMKNSIGDEVLFEKLFNDLDLYENIVDILTYEKSSLRRKTKIEELLNRSSLSLDEQRLIYEKIKTISFSGYLSISTKAVKRILPYLENGLFYSDAIEEENLKIEVEPQPYLPPLIDTDLMIPNPIVIRAITKSRHLINAILKKYRDIYNDEEWTFDRLNIELAREINTQKEKKEITTAQLKDRNNKQKAVDFIIENCGEQYVTSKNIEKVRLWQQQDEICLYSFKRISAEQMVSEITNNGDAFERDHILPISRSSDDSISNKVLVLSTENQKKSNRTPYEYFGSDKARWEKFENYIRSKEVYNKLTKAKIGKLLMKDFVNKEQEFLARHLNDTRIISKTVKNYVEKYLKFKNSTNERRVYVVSGKLTNTLRHQWGLENKNRDNHYHHFEDAVLIAFSNNSIINRLSKYYHDLETYKREGKDKPKFTKPYKNFIDDINAMIEKINVVRQPKIKNRGKVFHDNPKKGGIFKNAEGSMVRVDVFKDLKKEKYYLIPLYLKDLNKPLPTKFITAGKKEWEEFNPSKQRFVFSLYPNDLIEVETKTDTIRGYYVSTDASTANITIQSMDNIANTVFTKEIIKYTLRISIENILDSDSRKKEIENIAKLNTIKKKKPNGTLTLSMDIKINDIKASKSKKSNLSLILDELQQKYSIDKIKNNTKELDLPINIKNDNEIKLTLEFNTDYDNRALRGTGVKTKTLGFKKLQIDLLGNITELPFETERKPFIKR